MKPDETQNRMQSEMTNEAGTLLEIRNRKVRFTARKKARLGWMGNACTQG